jgi:Pyruvate/2-oxoacid:ferredoxin oxidoreductase delta subunit
MKSNLEILKGNVVSINQIFIPSILRLSFPDSFSGKKIHYIGEYPRRVQQFEKIAHCEGFYLNAPLAGIVSIYEENNHHSFILRVSGRNQITNYFRNGKEIFFPEEIHQSNWIEFLNQNGLYSFEYKKPLSEFFNEKISQIIFLLSDPYLPLFWQNLFKYYQKELSLLKQFFYKNFSNIRLIFFPEENKTKLKQNEYNYKFHYRYLRNRYNSDTKILSSATLFALIRALFYNEPFTKNICFINDYSKKKYYVSFFYHGTNLKEINYNFPYLMNFSYKNIINLQEDNYFNIYEDYYFFYKNRENKNICTMCMMCNNYCPVNAYPMSLFENKFFFKRDRCFVCGICEEVCESSLPLMDKIKYEVFD